MKTVVKCANPKCKNQIDLEYYDPNEYTFKLFDNKTKKMKYYCCHTCFEEARIQREIAAIPKSMRSKFLLNQVVSIKKGNSPFQQDFCNKIGRVFEIHKVGKKFMYDINFNGCIMYGIEEKLVIPKR